MMTPFAGVSTDLLKRLASIRLLALDVDGVLTDGRLYFSANGDELKAFNILDGLGLKQIRSIGVEVALITGRRSPLTARRAEDLGLKYLIQGREDKLVALTELLQTLNLDPEAVGYVGDDLPDLKAIVSVGAGMTVANGHWAVKEKARYCTEKAGGEGAVREICDLILYARGKLDEVLAPYQPEPIC
jgi:3-deoxy-D-manno-octulosonate 8-phosphate phosphatase (KDO 8-P phosphatase)